MGPETEELFDRVHTTSDRLQDKVNEFRKRAWKKADELALEELKEASDVERDERWAELDRSVSVSAFDEQVSGDHYRKHGNYQPWQVLARWLTPEELRGFGKGTAVAYLARERDKGGDEDIRKAIHTLQLYLELAEKEYGGCKDAP